MNKSFVISIAIYATIMIIFILFRKSISAEKVKDILFVLLSIFVIVLAFFVIKKRIKSTDT
jgi:ABC-type nickel/cobalt efflux system permease component RcnA